MMIYISSRWLVRVDRSSAIVSAVSRMTSSFWPIARARPEVVVIRQLAPEAIKFRMVPKYVRPVGQLNTSGEALLDEKRLADLFDEVSLTAGEQLPLLEAGSDRHDTIEVLGNAALVVGQGDADRHGLGEQQQTLGRVVFESDCAVGNGLIFAIRIDDNLRGLAFALGKRLNESSCETLDDCLLLEGVHADEHGRTEAKQGDSPAARRLEGERIAGKLVSTFQALEIDAFGQLKGSGDEWSVAHASL